MSDNPPLSDMGQRRSGARLERGIPRRLDVPIAFLAHAAHHRDELDEHHCYRVALSAAQHRCRPFEPVMHARRRSTPDCPTKHHRAHHEKHQDQSNRAKPLTHTASRYSFEKLPFLRALHCAQEP